MSYLPVNEGQDHINVYSKSSLLVGRQLSNFAHSPFKHPQDGSFFSVEGYWYWLATGGKHECLRMLTGITAKTEGQRLAKQGRIECVDFNERVLEAIRCKLRQHRDILSNLVQTTLPLTHYYWYGDINKPNVITLEKHRWMIDEMMRIRSLMQDKEPRR